MPARPCLDCDNLTRNGSRCPECERANTAERKSAGLTGHIGRHVPAAARRAALRRANHCCVRCGISARALRSFEPPKYLELHHRDGNTKNNDQSNIVVYCPDCHHVVERELAAAS